MNETVLQPIPNSNKFRLKGLNKEQIEILKNNKGNIMKALLAIGGTALVAKVIYEYNQRLEHDPTNPTDSNPIPKPELIPEPTSDQKPEIIDPTPEPNPEPNPDPNPEPTPDQKPEIIPEPTPEPIPDPNPEPTPISEEEIIKIIDIEDTINDFEENEIDEDLIDEVVVDIEPVELDE